MFLHSDNAESRAVEGEIIRRFAVRVIDALSRDAVTAANRVQETSCDCQTRQVKKDHSDSGIVTLAGIETIFVEALYPILERLDSMERKFFKADCADRHGQDSPITVTPSSTPAVDYDDDNYEQAEVSPNSIGSYTFASLRFDPSETPGSENDGSNDFESSSTLPIRTPAGLRSLFKAPDPPGNANKNTRNGKSPHP
ncbi:hypothetical protein QFC20_000888 [Naganishia adeliensis]|uniref:Uncharacterized protein n=1 Tax=Naganishia adeliensis TaxID=92952 RepID=A0ACC2WVS9_9TREE|nr:hypothetical protein QFC20_000888 [Naganishia adeliensis]